MLGVGDTIPQATVWVGPREQHTIEEILVRGNGADRQLRTFNANRDVVEVVSDIADVTERATVSA